MEMLLKSNRSRLNYCSSHGPPLFSSANPSVPLHTDPNHGPNRIAYCGSQSASDQSLIRRPWHLALSAIPRTVSVRLHLVVVQSISKSSDADPVRFPIRAQPL